MRMMQTPLDSFFDNDTGGGAPWLQLHLQDGYHRRWSTALSDGELDASIADTSLSRWVNYYVQGLQWLTEDHTNTSRIDGLYLDELRCVRTSTPIFTRPLEWADGENAFRLGQLGRPLH